MRYSAEADLYCCEIKQIETPLLSYRHAFHAGNFADLLKHFVQVEILQYMIKKDKPFDYIDTHAGAGLYKLGSDMAKKNAEFKNGIAHYFGNEDAPKELATYLKTIAAFNPHGLKHYPGSPSITEHFLRSHDKSWLFELHGTDHQLLERNFEGQRNIRIRQEDGFKGLLSLLPCQSRRAFVLIDPPFERKDDYQKIPQTVKAAYKKMPNTVFAIWYPVVDRRRIRDLQRSFKHGGIKNVCVFELGQQEDSQDYGMTASGMIVINPPWTLKETMEKTLPVLAKKISTDGKSHFHIEQLVAE